MVYCNVVILDIVSPQIAHTFTYKIPPRWQTQLCPGTVVKVPFGSRRVLAVVYSLVQEPGIEPQKIKTIAKVLHEVPAFNQTLLALAEWIKDYYACSLAKVMHKMLPRGLKLEVEPYYVTYIYLDDAVKSLEDAKLPSNATVQRRLIQSLLANPKQTLFQLKQDVNCSDAPIHSLVKKGVATLEKKRIYREPVNFKQLAPYTTKAPTQEQEFVLKLIKRQMTYSGEKSPIVLFGVTGSGKTEIYLQVIAEYLKRGQDTIVLIPEISLTPQTIARFAGRFGEKVAVMHSRLSVGERFDQWEKVLRGEAKVVVGPRSAIFAPCKNLGLIIIDEEHENSYKQEEDPRYHAREVARKRAQLAEAQLIMGSATPSIKSMYQVEKGNYQLAELKERIASTNLPTVRVVNMKSELENGNRSIFSQVLQKQIKAVTDAGKQVILFLNRRGFSTFFLCRECGHTVKCPRCEVTLTYHKSTKQLVCHYCDYLEPPVNICPNCRSYKIKGFGTGTQRIQEELHKIFPWLTTIRMDVDTTRRKHAHQQLLEKFQKKEAQVLIGTQMIAKGLDFPDVSVVGVISADTSLHLPDFRAGEKTFQLLTQVAGRAGRGGTSGHVIIQTYNPSHYSIKAVEKDDVRYFIQQEMESRKQLRYPPYTRLIRILLRAPHPDKLWEEAEALAERLAAKNHEVLGPNPCPIEKIKDDYRWHILIKQNLHGDDLEDYDQTLHEELVQIKYNLQDEKDIKMAVDIDPLNLL